jgi:hypothetical protein
MSVSDQPSETKAEKATKDNEDWYVACSDEEVYTKPRYVKGKMETWAPEPKEMIELLESIDKTSGESVPLEWNCNRRPPTPSTESEYSDSDDEAARLEAAKAAKDFDFDADEDMNTTPTMSRKSLPGSAQRELKGSARKKTTDLKSILSNIQRHRKIDEAAASSDPATPTSSK